MPEQDEPTTTPTDEPAPPVKRTRRRAVADPGEPEAPTEPAAEAPAEVDGDGAAPTRTRRRRTAAVVTFQAPVVDPAEPAVEAELAAAEPSPADSADSADPADPDAPPARRRRRAGTTGVIAPATFLAPEPAPSVPDEDDDEDGSDDRPRRRRRGGRGRARGDDDGTEPTTADGAVAETAGEDEDDDEEGTGEEGSTRRRRRRRRRPGSGGGEGEATARRDEGGGRRDEEDGVRGISGSTRMAAKRARRQEGRDSGRRRPPILSEAEFLARRESVERVMVVRQTGDRTQIAVLEDGVLVEHYVTKASAQSYAGNVYLGRVQNVLPSMEAAFVDIGKSRNAVLYAGEVNYDGQSGGGQRKIEQVLKGGQEVLVQVSKDPIGHKGARLTSQISLPGRYLVYVPEGSMTGISRKLPENERNRLKAILKAVVPEHAGVIIRTAAEGVSEEEIARDVRRLQAQWEVIQTKAAKGGAPVLLHAEPDLVIRVVRDVFNEDFAKLVVQGNSEWDTIRDYVEFVAPDLAPRLSRYTGDGDVFSEHRVDEQLAKALDRKVWLPSGGSLVIDRTEAMVVIDVNTGKYVGKGGNLEETVTRNNLEAAEEIARQLRLRDLGGIIVIDFIDMVLESNRDLVVRRLVECLGRDRTKHQVAEVTSLGLVQMTRKRVGQGLLESFSTECDHCHGRGVIISSEPVEQRSGGGGDRSERGERRERGKGGGSGEGRGGSGEGRRPKPGPSQPPAEAEPAAGLEAAAEPSPEVEPVAEPSPAVEPVAEVAPEPAAAPVRRPRRAISRPAGPPAVVVPSG